jgi:hypothetical protein
MAIVEHNIAHLSFVMLSCQYLWPTNLIPAELVNPCFRVVIIKELIELPLFQLTLSAERVYAEIRFE